MKVIADICVVPITGKTSVREEVRRAHEILVATGLPTHLHAYGTNIEGDYDVIFGALRRVHEELHALGVVRISTSIRVGSRIDKPQGIADKIGAITPPRATRRSPAPGSAGRPRKRAAGTRGS